MPSTPSHPVAPDAGSLLSVTVLPRARPGHVLIEVIGEVDTFTAPALELCLASQTSQRGVRELIVDMSQVTFLGAAAISVLAQAQRQCRLRGARLVLRSGGRRHVLLSLQLIGFTELATIEVDLQRKEDLKPRIREPRRTCRSTSWRCQGSVAPPRPSRETR
jgi:anti-anti-sigma factor